MHAEPSLGLRERKKLDTRRALSDAALTLAFENGLENVTREDIAGRAGVSLRTFSNYFTGKYDAIAYRQTERVRRSLDALRSRPADEPLWAAVTAAVLEPLETEGAADVLPSAAQLAEVRKVMSTPQATIAATHGAFADWAEVIAARTGTDAERDLYPRLVVGVIAAVVEAATKTYVNTDPPVHITTVLRQGFATVADGLPAPSHREGHS
ncbi:TetR family transcriptional regulator [soil metagenome]